MRGILLLIVLFCSTLCNAQDMGYARRMVDTLASPHFDGRGYVNDGHKRAALFIANEFEQMGLEKFRSYLQSYPLVANVFPDTMQLQLDDRTLTPGVDYVAAPFSGSGSGTFNLKYLNKDNVNGKTILNDLRKADLSNTFLVVDTKGAKEANLNATLQNIAYNGYDAAGIIQIEENDFTWSVVNYRTPFPGVRIMRAQLQNAKTITLNIKSNLQLNIEAFNVAGYVKGTEYPDSFVLFSAHYDHLGRMGKDTYFPGANDNASGTAMLLNLAKHYAANPAKYSTVFIAFGGEEAGLIGSNHYVEHPLFPLEQITFQLNMDIFGTGDEGITVVNATLHPKAFERLKNISDSKKYLAEVKPRGETSNSDHFPFSFKGVPAFFIYTRGGIKAYHDVFDKPETLPLTEFEDLFKLLTDFVSTM